MHRRPDLYTRWSLEMRSKQFFRPGQRLGVGVSGGPDSVLLLQFMKKLASELGLTVAAVHFNHRLRGAESDGDEALVRDLAAELQVDYLRGEADVARVARERHGNLEAVARELRYRFFFKLVDQGRLDLVATAHTANDQAETVLMRLLRGTGTRGLGGIYPVLEGKVVRPFLGLTREEVVKEIAERKISYRVDSSNLNMKLRRNKVRNELLPLLAKEYNPQIVSLLNQFADRARDDEACLERLARDRSHPWWVREGREERIPIRVLGEFPASLARRVLRQMLQVARGTSHGLTHTHIESLRRFASQAQSGKVQNLPGGGVARKEFSWLVVAPTPTEPAGGDYSYAVTFPGKVTVPEVGALFHFKILTREDPGKAYNLNKLVCLDPRKLLGELELRNWRAGDRFCPVGSRGVRKLKELFRERKIPEVRRKGWPVLLCARQIVWVRGFPPSKGAAANAEAPLVLIVEEEPLRSLPIAREQSV
jgi:tRNA(Ile)-lysidine synthase